MDPLYAGENYAVEPSEAKALELSVQIFHPKIFKLFQEIQKQRADKISEWRKRENDLMRFGAIIGTVWRG